MPRYPRTIFSSHATLCLHLPFFFCTLFPTGHAPLPMSSPLFPVLHSSHSTLGFHQSFRILCTQFQCPFPMFSSPLSIPCHPYSLLRLLSAYFIPYAPCTHRVSPRFFILLIPYSVHSKPSNLSTSQLSHRVLPSSLPLPHSVFRSHTFSLSLFSERHAHSQCSPLNPLAPPASLILHMWF